jgi:glutathionylspermidine synthase
VSFITLSRSKVGVRALLTTWLLLKVADIPETEIRLRGESFVEKPIISREGSNITIMDGDEVVATTGGSYGDYKKVYQLRAPTSSFDGHHIVIGSWIIGDEPAGIGIREDTGLITTNTSLFVPHSFD